MKGPSPEERIEAAKMEAERARGRFGSSLAALQHKLKPGNLADQAWSGVKDKSSDLADSAAEAVKARPAAAAGAIAALVLFLARRPIAAGAGKFWNHITANNHDEHQNGAGTNPKIAGLEE